MRRSLPSRGATLILSRWTTGLRPGLLAGLLLAALPSLTGAADDEAPSAGRWQQLLVQLDAIRKDAGVAGVALLIADADRVRHCSGLGVEDWQTKRPMRCNSLIRIGSVTKAITGLTFLHLAADGVVDLNRPLKDFVDEPPGLAAWNNPWASTHPITLAQLLEHTAGLRDLSRREFDHNDPVSLEQALAVDPDSRRLLWPPGQHSSYSNSGAGLAAWALESATGLEFEAEAQRRVLQPLGMASARFVLTDSIRESLATGYDSDGRTVIPYWHTLYRPFGGLNLRFSEMGALLRLLLGLGHLDGERVFAPEQIRRMETPETTLAARRGLKFGYGLGNYAAVHAGFVFYGHGGDADGYLSHYGYSRDLGLGYFIVINAYRGDTLRRMRRVVMDHLVANRSPAYAPPQPQPSAALQRLAGRYASVTSRFGEPGQRTLEVRYEDKRLFLLRGEHRQPLLPLGQGWFRRPYEPVATTAFISTGDGLILQGPFGNYRRLD